MTDFESPRLIADIGGTYARFALETALGRFEPSASLRCAEHADFHAAVSAYLATLPDRRIEHAAVAIANPVEGDSVRMTNYHWQFSIEQMRERLRLDTLVVVNDFTALAMAVPWLAADDRRQVGAGATHGAGVVGVLGAGTGLGVSGLIPSAEGWVALGTEGGHTNVAPRDEREFAVLRYAMQQYSQESTTGRSRVDAPPRGEATRRRGRAPESSLGRSHIDSSARDRATPAPSAAHVSFERLLSGAGLQLIHAALAERAGRPHAAKLTAPEITRSGLDGSDALCAEAIEVFCLLLATVASNLALTLGATGGIYIGGGIVPRLGRHFDASGFRARFEDKGRFSDYVRAIPTFVITAENATLVGASAILQSQLLALEGAPRSAILEQVRRGLGDLSPAERRVAEHVLAHPRAALNDPIAAIARGAAVSQPTVIRFCRSLGCEGLSDFKLRLASGLTGTVPVTHAQVTADDSMAELGDKVLGNTAAAILQLRDQLNRDTIDRAIELLNRAELIELHAVGNFSVVALDAQYKFLRFGIACNACTDPRLQVLSANVLGPNDVAVIVSGHGRIAELLEVAERARARGAAVIAITASQSPLARMSDLALIVDHVEDVNSHLPMVSRILHLLLIDILAVGVAMRRSAVVVGVDDDAEAVVDMAAAASGHAAPPAARQRRSPPGVSASTPLSRLSSHSSSGGAS